MVKHTCDDCAYIHFPSEHPTCNGCENEKGAPTNWKKMPTTKEGKTLLVCPHCNKELQLVSCSIEKTVVGCMNNACEYNDIYVLTITGTADNRIFRDNTRNTWDD
jgi:hypothetical protein